MFGAAAESDVLTNSRGATMTHSLVANIDGERLWQRLMQLAQFGAIPKGGVRRLALSDEEIAARAQLVKWGRAVGLAAYTDSVANLFLRLDGRDPSLSPIVTGSHIDTQPTGGKFDGAYGVIAALEAVEAIARVPRPLRSIEVVAWTNEEGSRFIPGIMGSAVYVGRRSLDSALALVDSDGTALREARDRVLAADDDIPLRELQRPMAAFIEAHIEQASRLEEDSIPVGIGTGIQGRRTFRVSVIGEEGHAGATPRSRRRDALVAAVQIIHALQKEIWDDLDEVRFTIGRLNVSPNVPMVVPGRVDFSIDLRHPDAGTIQRLARLVGEVCLGNKGRYDVEIAELVHDDPVAFPKEIRRHIAQAADSLELASVEMLSPAGHDARFLTYLCPTGMIFIPCADGTSHNEAESITPEDALAGTRVLTETVYRLAQQ
jgi:N-carbamoyl-L-amino-acid hydrolase